jgi:ABC-type glutathione transport system ATPase component
MVLPFAPLAVAFNNMRYSVDMPAEMKAQGVDQDRLLLLKGVSGSFKPGVLTALMGVSGAGKTTLMDVLAGRKTGGYIEGDISISGYPKKQETFARISGYCEQNDIHSPNVTVYESLVYSAWLRLPSDVESETRKVRVVVQIASLAQGILVFSEQWCSFLTDVHRASDGAGRIEFTERCTHWTTWSQWLVNRAKEEVDDRG